MSKPMTLIYSPKRNILSHRQEIVCTLYFLILSIIWVNTKKNYITLCVGEFLGDLTKIDSLFFVDSRRKTLNTGCLYD